VRRKLKRAVRNWLLLERESRHQQSDRALQGVFLHLPPESVPYGFADRLMARAGLAPVPQQSMAAIWGLRAAVSCCLVLMALFLLVIPSYLPALLGIFNFARATELGVNAVVGVTHQLGLGLVIWRTLSAAGAILSSTLSSPPYLAALFLGVLLSIGALRLLHEVIIAERSTRYASSA